MKTDDRSGRYLGNGLWRAIRRFALPLAVIVAIPAIMQFSGATPAAALEGIVRSEPTDAPANSNPSQTRTAVCPLFMHVVGGGALIVNGGDQVRLTELRPFNDRVSLGGDPPLSVPVGKYVATAEEPDTGYSPKWELVAVAICARGLTIVRSTRSAPSSAPYRQQTAANCLGEPVIGTGAKILHSAGQVGLQLMRPAAPLDIARVAAHEDADGYARDWQLEAYVICGARKTTESAALYYSPHHTNQTGQVECPRDKVVHSVGGGAGGGSQDPGPHFLKAVWPAPDLKSAIISMTGPPTGGVAVAAVCAYPRDE